MTETRWWQLILRAKDRIAIAGSKARAAVRVLRPVGWGRGIDGNGKWSAVFLGARHVDHLLGLVESHEESEIFALMANLQVSFHS